jgi:GNAT superfamily N-acetyltransferase
MFPPQLPTRRAVIATARSGRDFGISVDVASSDVDKAATLRVWGTAGWERDESDDEHETEYVLARDASGRPCGAGRMLRRSNNVLFDRLFLIEEWRGRGAGRILVTGMIDHVLKYSLNTMKGCIFVDSPKEYLGFFSLLGFEGQGNDCS